jgi:hypothetical protein
MTFINRHYLSRNSPEDADYDSSMPRVELLYIDANNLYGHALSMSLPQSNFQWMECTLERQHLIANLATMNISGDKGFVAEVDLIIPPHLHDILDDLPLAPEKSKTSKEWMTPYMESMLDGARYQASEKLLLTHLPKFHYVVHFALLQFYVKMGVVINKIHRIVTFQQSSFFEPYITFNSKQRQLATTEFSKDFFKLKNNSLFGKTMENVRCRMDMRLCQTAERLRTYSSKPLFKSVKMFSPELVGVQLLKEEVLLDRPVYIRQAVLDLSKLVIYELRYKSLSHYAQRFGGSITIAGGDTDSFFVMLKGISLNQQLLPAMAIDGLLDSSNYPSSHPLYSSTNKARLGCVKDEGAGEVWKEWVLLKPKCYSMCTVNEHEHKRAKGVQRSVVANEIYHKDYVAIFEGCQDDYRSVRRFSSTRHTITTVEQRKKALSLWEDKRAWISLNESKAYGHHSLLVQSKRARFSVDDLL